MIGSLAWRGFHPARPLFTGSRSEQRGKREDEFTGKVIAILDGKGGEW